MAEEIKYKAEGNNNGTRFPSFDTQSANRDDIEAIFIIEHLFHPLPLLLTTFCLESAGWLNHG